MAISEEAAIIITDVLFYKQHFNVGAGGGAFKGVV